MEPRIQYAQTTDGVSIAFYTLGEGSPLVYLPPPMTFIESEWQVQGLLPWYERLAEKRKVIRYESREFGLAKGEEAGSLEAQMLDLEAVVGRLGLDRFALYASVFAGVVAITYAAHHPERVSHLILAHSYARGSDVMKTPQAEGLIALLDKDWVMFTETWVRVGLGWSAGEPARHAAATMREKATPEGIRSLLGFIGELDVTDLLPRVKSPTLVIQRRQVAVPDVTVAKNLASQIPEARLVLLEGESIVPYMDDAEAMYQAIDEFLGEEPTPEGKPPEAGAMRTILFTDMEGSTDLTQRLGDAGAQDCLRTHNTIVRGALGAHGGSEIKHTGDGIMASFASASSSLEAAIAIQKAFADHNQDSAHTTIRVRIGLNAGEPVAEDDDLFGTAVQLAARVCAQAEPGQILTSNVVQELAAGKGFDFADKGEATLKGFETPVRLYEVRWQG